MYWSAAGTLDRQILESCSRDLPLPRGTDRYAPLFYVLETLASPHRTLVEPLVESL